MLRVLVLPELVLPELLEAELVEAELALAALWPLMWALRTSAPARRAPPASEHGTDSP